MPHEWADDRTGFGQRLLEREAEVASLRVLASVAAAGEGAIAAIEGPAGIGKSRLLREALVIAGDAGMRRLEARGSDLERDVPFGVVRQLFEPYLAGVPGATRRDLLSGAAGLAAPVVTATREGRRSASDPESAVLHGLFWLAASIADRDPFAMFIDDAHWADAPSLRYLAYLAGRASSLPVLLVVARRAAEPGADVDLLDHVAASPLACSIHPSALGLDSVAELVREALGTDPDASFVAACRRATNGNPLFLRELLALLAEGRCAPVARNAHHVHEVAPGSVARSVRRRIARLGPDCVAFARAAAVLGPGTDIETAEAVAGLDRSAASDAADALARIDVLAARTIDFRHPIVQAAIYSELPSREAARLHDRAARVLADRGRDEDQVAAHVLATEPAGDASTIELLRRVARRARECGAPEIAGRHLERALAEGPVHDVRAELLRELGGAELAAAKPGAVDHLRQAFAATADPAARATVGLELARTLTLYGDMAAAADAIETALDGLDHRDPQLADRLDAELIALAISDLALRHRADARVMRLFEEGDAIRDPVRLATLAAVMASVMEPASRGADLAERALAAPGLSPERDQLLYLHAANALASANRFAAARRIWDRAADEARGSGSISAFAFACTLRAGICVRIGALSDAEADLGTPLDIVEGDPRLPFSFVATPLTHVLIERGDLTAADRLHPHGSRLDLPERIDQNFVLEAVGRLRLAQERTEEGIALIRELGRRLAAFGIRNPAAVAWRSMVAPPLARAGHGEEARALVREELDLARGFAVPREVGVALRALAVVGAPEGGVELLREAVSVLEGTPARLEHARALTDLGATLAHDGYRSEAREPLRLALELARRCGATVLVKRAHAELVASGARPRRLAFSGIEALTASERRTAGMAARGMTNREIAQALFVTEKTVENHLLHAYRKLDINSRSELPAALTPRD